jgi:hypothetical protein
MENIVDDARFSGEVCVIQKLRVKTASTDDILIP